MGIQIGPWGSPSRKRTRVKQGKYRGSHDTTSRVHSESYIPRSASLFISQQTRKSLASLRRHHLATRDSLVPKVTAKQLGSTYNILGIFTRFCLQRCHKLERSRKRMENPSTHPPPSILSQQMMLQKDGEDRNKCIFNLGPKQREGNNFFHSFSLENTLLKKKTKTIFLYMLYNLLELSHAPTFFFFFLRDF